MKRRCLVVGAAALWLGANFASAEMSYPNTTRIVSVGGSLTEIIYALGEQDRLVARDTTSSYPAVVMELPDVGYMRRLSPEGVMSVNPDLVLAEEGSGPPETIELLQAASIPFVSISDGFNRQGIVNKINEVGVAIGVPEKAAQLAAKVGADLLAAETAAAAQPEKRRVLFILSTQGGRILASGTGTAADGIIQMAGGINVINQFSGYKPLTDEAITAAAPDVILLMDRGGDHGANNDTLFAMPAIITTPAALTKSAVRMNGLFLLGFGPRTAKAITELHQKLYDGEG